MPHVPLIGATDSSPLTVAPGGPALGGLQRAFGLSSAADVSPLYAGRLAISTRAARRLPAAAASRLGPRGRPTAYACRIPAHANRLNPLPRTDRLS